MELSTYADDQPDVWRDGEVVRVVPCEQVQEAGQWATDAVPVGLPDGWAVEIHCDGDNYWTGWANEDGHRIELFPLRAVSPEHLLSVATHEYGHAWDHAVLTDEGRALWATVRGYPTEDWWDQTRDDPYAGGAEDFAEAFSFCHVGMWKSDRDQPGPLDCVLARLLVGDTQQPEPSPA